MSYVQENLMPNEKVLFTARIHPAIFLPAGVYFLIGVLIGAGSFLLDNRFDPGEVVLFEGSLCLAAIFVLFTVVYALQAALVRLTTEFAVTNRRIIAKAGFIRRHTLEMLLQKIESVAVTQSLTGRILNYGNITVTGTGGTRERFTAIAEPLAVRRHINQILERYTEAFADKPVAAAPVPEELAAVG